ncbi:MAG: nucleotidyltransferase domain-containing protein [Anaerolineales bacterium]|jgi:predicted nucleotidyltransferase
MTDKASSNHPELARLEKVFKKYPGIQAVYLFGSTASGRTHMESDLDLAILPEKSSLRGQKLDILTDLAREGFSDVDLVFLDTKDVVIKFESVHQNRLLYCVKDFDANAFFSLVLRQYFDFAPYLKIQREAYKQRVLHDGQNRSYS